MRYQRKPEVVEAMQWTGSNLKKIREWLGVSVDKIEKRYSWLNIYRNGRIYVVGKGNYIIFSDTIYIVSEAMFLKQYEPIE
jgi:hypothetical protein